MDRVQFGATSTAAAETRVFVGRSAHTGTGPAYAVRSGRAGSQAYYWAPEWQQREKLADYDFAIGNVYRPADVEDLIRWLHED